MRKQVLTGLVLAAFFVGAIYWFPLLGQLDRTCNCDQSGDIRNNNNNNKIAHTAHHDHDGLVSRHDLQLFPVLEMMTSALDIATCRRGRHPGEPSFACGEGHAHLGEPYANLMMLDYLLALKNNIKEMWIFNEEYFGDVRHFETAMRARGGVFHSVPKLKDEKIPNVANNSGPRLFMVANIDDNSDLVERYLTRVQDTDVLCVNGKDIDNDVNAHKQQLNLGPFLLEYGSTISTNIKCYVKGGGSSAPVQSGAQFPRGRCPYGTGLDGTDNSHCNDNLNAVGWGNAFFPEHPKDFSVSNSPSACGYITLMCRSGWHTFGKIASPCSWADKMMLDTAWRSKPSLTMILELGALTALTSVFLGSMARERNATFHTFDITDSFVHEARAAWLPNMQATVGSEGDLLSSVNPKLENLIRNNAVMVFFDNGDKNKELLMYGGFLKPGDICCVHDWDVEINVESSAVAARQHQLQPLGWEFARIINSAVRCWER